MYFSSWVLPALSLALSHTSVSARTITSLRDLRPRQGATTGAGGKKTSTATGETPDGGCGKYVIISARGTGEKQNNPTGYSGFIKGLMKQVPGGTNYEVVYPATVDYWNGPKVGFKDAMQFITKRKDKCPKQPMVLIGYSEGAMVVHGLVSEKGFPAEQVSSLILYGSPFWQPNKPYNKGTAKTGKGVSVFTGMYPMPPALGPRIQDICLTGDLVCTGSGSMGPHLRYPNSQYEKDAIAFSAAKLAEPNMGTGPLAPVAGGEAGGAAPPKGMGATLGKGKRT